jgi:hypothetical protein
LRDLAIQKASEKVSEAMESPINTILETLEIAGTSTMQQATQTMIIL